MITVTTTAGERNAYPIAEAWHVDEQGDLHVRKPTSGNVATYARGLWVSVAQSTTPPDLIVKAKDDGAAEAILEMLLSLKKRRGGRRLGLD